MAKLRIIINFVSHLFRMKNIVLVGSGNVATHLGLSLVNKGYKIKQVWSRKRAAVGFAHPAACLQKGPCAADTASQSL